ncbi:MAG: AlpA family phage regulatory protein [Oligoflexia bacterium]|nr:AlpA family phage regulatory protein [Oligoflexia bacterium]
MNQDKQIRIIKLKETAKKTSLSMNTVLKLMRDSDFPERISLTPDHRRFGWIENEVDELLLSRRNVAIDCKNRNRKVCN